MESITVWSHLLKKSLMENFIFCAEHMDGSREYEKRRNTCVTCLVPYVLPYLTYFVPCVLPIPHVPRALPPLLSYVLFRFTSFVLYVL